MNITRRTRFLLLSSAVTIIACAVAFKPFRQRLQPQATLLQPTHFIQASDSIDRLLFNPQGNRLLTIERSPSRQATLWNLNLKSQYQWKDAGERVWFSSRKNHLLTCDYDRQSRRTRCVWRDGDSGRTLRQWVTEGYVTDVARDFSVISTLQFPRTPLKQKGKGAVIRIREVATGRVRQQIPLRSDEVWEIRFSDDARYLTVVSHQDPAQLLGVIDGRSRLALPQLVSLRLAADGRSVIGLSKEAILHIWQLPSHRHASLSTGLVRGRELSLLASGEIVVKGERKLTPPTKGNQDVVQVWSSDGTHVLRTLVGRPEVCSPDGHLLSRWTPARVATRSR